MRWLLGLLALLALSIVYAGGHWANVGILAYHAVCAGALFVHRRQLKPLFAWRPGIGRWSLLASIAILIGLALLVMLADPSRYREAGAAALFPGPDRMRSFKIALVYTMVFHASLEEIFWRGAFTNIEDAPAPLLIGNAVTFYLVHVIVLTMALGSIGILAALPTAVAGLAWGWVTTRTNSIWPALISHWVADAAILFGMWFYFLKI